MIHTLDQWVNADAAGKIGYGKVGRFYPGLTGISVS
jgi:hypothetical protein